MIMEVVNKNPNVYADFSESVLGDFNSKYERYMQEQLQDMVMYPGQPKYLLLISRNTKKSLSCKKRNVLFKIDIKN